MHAYCKDTVDLDDDDVLASHAREIVIMASGNIAIGGIGLNTQTGLREELGGLVRAVDKVDVTAGGNIEIAAANDIITTAADSDVELSAGGSLTIIGAIYAGVTVNATPTIIEDNADILLIASKTLTLGGFGVTSTGADVLGAGSAQASGRIEVTTTSDDVSKSLKLGVFSFLRTFGNTEAATAQGQELTVYEIDIATSSAIDLQGHLFAERCQASGLPPRMCPSSTSPPRAMC